MKFLFTFLFTVSSALALAQDDIASRTILEAPDSWRPEIINFPLSFAPSLDYTGFEDIRFSKGWADTTAVDYFAYTFVWYINENPKLTEEKLETQMKAYFDGLMSLVAERNDLPKTKAEFDFIRSKDTRVASGTVSFYEAFFKKKVITMRVGMTSEPCRKTKKHLVRFYLAPIETADQLMSSFDEVKLKVDCGG